MSSLNKAMIIGRLCADPEKRVTQGGKSVVSVSIATSEKYKDQQGTLQETTEFHRVVFWDKLADIVSKYLNKGSLVYVEGQLKTRDWQDKDGNKRYSTEIQAKQMQMLGSKNDSQPRQQQYQQPQQNYQDHQVPPSNDDYLEDPIPF